MGDNQEIHATQVQAPVADSQPSQPTIQTSVQPPKNASHGTFMTAVIFLIILGILAGTGYILLHKKNTNTPQAAQTITSLSPTQIIEAKPTPVTIDTAPAIPAKQKAQILIHHSDSTFSLYLVPVPAVAAYSKTLPQGDTVVKVTNP